MINKAIEEFNKLYASYWIHSDDGRSPMDSKDAVEAFLRKECEAVIEACAQEAERWQAKWVGSTPYSDIEVGEAIRGLKGE